MKVLITGGSGYLGSHLCKRFKKMGWVVGILDLAAPEHQYYDIFYPTDIRNRDGVDTALRGRYDLVIHCAGRIEVGDSQKNPTEFWEVNVGGTAILLNAMKRHGVKKIMFSSTAAVYKPSEQPLTEECEKANNSVYGHTKLACEAMLGDSGFQYGVFRYFNLAGADEDIGENHQPETHLIPMILRNRDNVGIFGNDYDTPDGTCIRDYVHVLDVVDAHIAALSQTESFVVNLGTGRGYSVMEIISELEKQLGVCIWHEILPRRDGDPARLVADISKAKKLLGYEPKHDMDSILKSAIAWESVCNKVE